IGRGGAGGGGGRTPLGVGLAGWGISEPASTLGRGGGGGGGGCFGAGGADGPSEGSGPAMNVVGAGLPQAIGRRWKGGVSVMAYSNFGQT
ncbi:MAG: hypothetical protein ACK4Z5_05350, partial [Brevundimonas sp.]